jgi:hypothetical protein
MAWYQGYYYDWSGGAGWLYGWYRIFDPGMWSWSFGWHYDPHDVGWNWGWTLNPSTGWELGAYWTTGWEYGWYKFGSSAIGPDWALGWHYDLAPWAWGWVATHG